MCDLSWYQNFLALNPREKLRRDLVVKYAESEGGVALDYLRRLMPRYWLNFDISTMSLRVGESLGLTLDQQVKILREMSAAFLPEFESSMEYEEGRRAKAEVPPHRTQVGAKGGESPMCIIEWYRQFFELNPKERRWRDLAVEYSESKGGYELEYLRRSNPEYWFESCWFPPGTAGPSLDLRPQEEVRIVSEMWRSILPVFRASPEYYPPPSKLIRPTWPGDRSDGL